MAKKLIGNAIVGQSGGPTAAINATLAGVIKGALECDAINTHGSRYAPQFKGGVFRRKTETDNGSLCFDESLVSDNGVA